MKPSFTFALFAVLGVIVGSVVGGGLSLHLRYEDVLAEVERKKSDLEAQWELKEVPLSAYELQPGEELQAHSIRVASFPSQFVTPSFLSVEEAHALSGSRVAHQIKMGDVLTRQLIVGADGGAQCDPEELVDAYVAKYPMRAGAPVDAHDFKRVGIPRSLHTSSVIDSIMDVDGELLTADLDEGDLLLEVHLAEHTCQSADGGTDGFAEDAP